MGRRFNDDKILNEAIEQYKFLRREYPGSRYRFDGLFTIGEIYKDDLNDSEDGAPSRNSCGAIRTIGWLTMPVRLLSNSTRQRRPRKSRRRGGPRRRNPQRTAAVTKT